MRVQGVARLLVLGMAMRKRQLRFPTAFPSDQAENTPFSFTRRDVLRPTYGPSYKIVVFKSILSLFGQLRWDPASSLEVPMDSTPSPTPRQVVRCFLSGSFCYCRHHLEILTRPSAVIKTKPDGPLSSTCTDVERAGSC